MIVAHTIISYAIEDTWPLSAERENATPSTVQPSTGASSQCITMIVRWMVELKCEKIVLANNGRQRQAKKKPEHRIKYGI